MIINISIKYHAMINEMTKSYIPDNMSTHIESSLIINQLV